MDPLPALSIIPFLLPRSAGPRPAEATSLDVAMFYRRLLAVLATPEFKFGRWHLGVVTPSRDGNDSWRSIVVFWITPSPGLGGLLRDRLLPPMPASVAPPSMSPTIAGVVATASAAAGTTSSFAASSSAQASAAVPPPPSAIPSAPAATPSGPSSGASDVTVPVVPLPAPAAVISGAPSSSSSSSSSSDSAITGRTFMVLVNYSDRPSNGHVLFSRADDSAYGNPDSAAAAAYVAGLCRGHLQCRGPTGVRLGTVTIPAAASSVGRGGGAATSAAASVTSAGAAATAVMTPAPVPVSAGSVPVPSGAGVPPQPSNTGRGVPSGPPPPVNGSSTTAATNGGSTAGASDTVLIAAATSSSSATAGARRIKAAASTSTATPVRRVAFLDHLSCYTKEYPATHIASEGWWVSLEPWKAAILEVVQLSDE